jgi:hypothetical protein
MESRETRVGVVGDLFVDLIALGVEAMPQWGQDTPCQGIRLCTPTLFYIFIYLIYKYLFFNTLADKNAGQLREDRRSTQR